MTDKATFYARVDAWLAGRPSRFVARFGRFRMALSTNRLGVMSVWALCAILLGIAATLLIVLGVAVYYGYWPESLVDNLTAPELAVIGVLCIVGAGGCAYAERRK